MTLLPKHYLLVGGFVLYTVGVWHVASTYTESSYRKDKLAQQDVVIKSRDETIKFGQRVLDFEQKRSKEQKTIEKEVVREIEKPVYRECRTTDDGVRLLERAIDSANQQVSSD